MVSMYLLNGESYMVSMHLLNGESYCKYAFAQW